jgi:mevalonate kinase
MVDVWAASGRASGKVILLGEHAVVYGSPAIAVALEQGAEAVARASFESRVVLEGASHDNAGSSDVGRAFQALLDTLGVSGIEASARLQIPAGAGLGASAALGVALARAVIAARPPGSRRGNVAQAALAWENVFHGNASGLDTAVAEHAGCVWFTRASGVARLPVGAPLRIAVAVAEPGASTRRMVEGVAARLAADRQRIEGCLRSITEIVERGRESIAAGDLSGLGTLLNRNHALLGELGVSTRGLDEACRIALDAGALGAKLTGAGGGGSVIALVEDQHMGMVRSAWASRGFECLEARAHG